MEDELNWLYELPVGKSGEQPRPIYEAIPRQQSNERKLYQLLWPQDTEPQYE